MILLTPSPRPAVFSPALTRPDWTKTEQRDPNRLWLDKNENTDPALAEIVRRAVAEIAPEAIWSYPDAGPLYRKLAAHVGVAADNLLLAAGSDGVIRSVFEAFVAPGDVVIHTDPTFAMYSVYSQMYGADVHTISYRPSNRGPVLAAEQLLEAIRQRRPRLVCLPNPDSPTGTVLEPDELMAVITAVGEVGAVMLVDEAYHPFYPHSVAAEVTRFPHLVVARSTGKAWGMAGIRIGYGIAAPELAGLLHKVRPMYETSTVSVAVFDRMLDHAADMLASVRRLEAGKRVFMEAMTQFGFATHAGHGNFLHVAFGSHATPIHTALADLVYYRQHFAQPCLKGFSRFSATTAQKFAPVIDRIDAVVENAR